jgi:hypothetical protein
MATTLPRITARGKNFCVFSFLSYHLKKHLMSFNHFLTLEMHS